MNLLADQAAKAGDGHGGQRGVDCGHNPQVGGSQYAVGVAQEIDFEDDGRQVDDTQGHQEFPADGHYLVQPQAWVGGTDPDEQEDADKGFDEEPEPAQPVGGRPGPAGEEEGGNQAGYDQGAAEFRRLYQGKLGAAVFGVIAGDNFRFGFGHIKGRPVQFGGHSGQENEEGQRLHQEEGDGLRGDNIAQGH